MALSNERCVACRRDSPRVTEEEKAELLPQVPEWVVTDSDGIDRVEREFKFRNFAQALEFTVRIGNEAEAEGHHPRLTVEWGRVGVEWWTHKIRGLHRNDLIMAAKTDQLYAQTQVAREA